MAECLSDVAVPKVVIAGAGLVGSLNACFFARKGWRVEVHESRNDIRKMEHVPGRSINLALSRRGMAALEAVGLKDYIVNRGVEMHARLIHDANGTTTHRQPYGQAGQFIVSINRRDLNETLITQAEQYANSVRFFFGQRAQKFLPPPDGGDGGGILILNTTSSSGKDAIVKVEDVDLLLACDGAYSTIRRSLMSQPHFQYTQRYIEHGYVELNVLPTKEGGYALEPNVFHLWPRGDFTLIALANLDRTFTVTIFAPFELFRTEMFVDGEPQRPWTFFQRHFPDIAPLLGRQHVLETFARLGAALPLISVKCDPHAFHNKRVVLMGDAAHAMVPFYGQGMNAGFEDCLVLSEMLTVFHDSIPLSVEHYSRQRTVDSHAIIDLAMYNYEELKDLVNRRGYKARRRFDLWLNRLLPNWWIPLYSMVTFTRIPYHRAVEIRAWQDKTLRYLTSSLLICGVGASVATLLWLNSQCIGMWGVWSSQDG